MSAAKIVGFTSLDTRTLLPLVEKVTGRNIASFADSKNLNPPLHHLQCLASFKGEETINIQRNVSLYCSMMNAVVLVVCDNRDTAEILELASLDSISSKTINRDFDCLLLSGTLTNWRASLLRGCSKSATDAVRKIFNLVYQQFVSHGLGDVLGVSTIPQRGSDIFLLEYRP